MMTGEQIQSVLATLVEQVAKLASASKPAQEEDGGAKREEPREKVSTKLDLKNFTRIEKFSGGDAARKDWSIEFKVVIVSVNPSMQKWSHIFETTRSTHTRGFQKAVRGGKDRSEGSRSRIKRTFRNPLPSNRRGCESYDPWNVGRFGSIPNAPPNLLEDDTSKNGKDHP